MSLLKDVEDFLVRRGKAVERRGKLDCISFLAYSLNIGHNDFDAFVGALRAEIGQPNPRLDVLADENDVIVYVGIPTTHATAPVTPEAAPAPERSAAELALEETQALLYLTQYESAQWQARAENAERELGEAQAAARLATTRATRAEADVRRLQLQWNNVEDLHKDAKEAAALRTKNEELRRNLERSANDVRTAMADAAKSREALEELQHQRSDHTCSVPRLRLIHTGPCGCAIIADHRNCNGKGLTKIDVMPHGTTVNVVFLSGKNWREELSANNTTTMLQNDPEFGGNAREIRRHAQRMAKKQNKHAAPSPRFMHEQKSLSTHVIHALAE